MFQRYSRKYDKNLPFFDATPLLGSKSNFLVLKGVKILCSAYGAAENPIYPNFRFFCSFKKQFCQKTRKKFLTLYNKNFVLIAFLKATFPKKWLAFSKRATWAQYFGLLAPQILSTLTPRSMEGQT